MSPVSRALLLILLLVLVLVGVAAARGGRDPGCANPVVLGAIASGDAPAHSHTACLDEAGRGVSNVAGAGPGAHAHVIEQMMDAGVAGGPGPAAVPPHSHSLSGAIRRGP